MILQARRYPRRLLPPHRGRCVLSGQSQSNKVSRTAEQKIASWLLVGVRTLSKSVSDCRVSLTQHHAVVSADFSESSAPAGQSVYSTDHQTVNELANGGDVPVESTAAATNAAPKPKKRVRKLAKATGVMPPQRQRRKQLAADSPPASKRQAAAMLPAAPAAEPTALVKQLSAARAAKSASKPAKQAVTADKKRAAGKEAKPSTKRTKTAASHATWGSSKRPSVAVREMMEMGFARAVVEQALIDCDGKKDRAVNMLIDV